MVDCLTKNRQGLEFNPQGVVFPLPWTNSLILPENNVHSGYKPSTTVTNHTLFFQNITFLKYQIAPVKPRVPKIGLADASRFIYGAEQRLLYSTGTLTGARRVQAALEATQLARARTLNLGGPGGFQVADHCRSNS